jgi:hypothetical protein
MTQEDLQVVAGRQPFRPFRVVLTTGATYDIHHPDLIAVGRRSATIGMTSQSDGTIHYDRGFFVDLIHIVGIQELPVAPASSNGSPV